MSANLAVSTYEACCVVDQHCQRPANLELEGEDRWAYYPPLPECFRCGEGVCIECSSRRKYMHYGVKRLCNNCQEDYDETPYWVIYRMALKSGYSTEAARRYASEHMTPKKAREEAQKKQREQKEWLKKLAELERTGPWGKNSTCGACGGTGVRKRKKLP